MRIFNDKKQKTLYTILVLYKLLSKKHTEQVLPTDHNCIDQDHDISPTPSYIYNHILTDVELFPFFSPSLVTGIIVYNIAYDKRKT